MREIFPQKEVGMTIKVGMLVETNEDTYRVISFKDSEINLVNIENEGDGQLLFGEELKKEIEKNGWRVSSEKIA